MRKSSILFALTALAINGTSALAAGELGNLPATPPIPKDNPMTKSKISLGRQLYFDKRLSKDNTVACNSCHNAMGSGVDNKPFSEGIKGQKGGRNAPTVLNAAYLSAQFWDGRAATLEDQAKGPIINPVEMGMPNHDAVVKKVGSIPGYARQFQEVFGGTDPVTIDNIAKAIAAYERTLVTPNTPYNKFLKGNSKALSASAQNGLKLVQSVGCVSCHSGPAFAGPALPSGTGFYQKFPMIPGSDYEKKYNLAADAGRFEVTKNPADKNMFRVPTWYNVAETAPYFHNGSVATLDEAVRVMAKTQLGRDLADNDVKDIVEFLKSLSAKSPEKREPSLPGAGG